jgi:poly-gamma-glutamate synthesis protein (capsule biosynthesis protein)
MKLSQLAQSFLCGVLVFLLIEINPGVSIFSHSWGEVAHLVQKESAHSFSESPQLVKYVAKQQPYDSLILVGDVLLARNIEFLMDQKGPDYPYRGLTFATISRRPAVVGNFESSIPQEHIPTPVKHTRFSVSASYIPQLALSGFTHLSLANNHTFDFIQVGFENTKHVLEQNQLTSFGHPNQLDINAVEFIEIQDKIVAVIAAHTLYQLPTYSELKVVFDYASARSDFQLVYVHWGTEYVSVHDTRQREAAERFVDAGADVVVGHHPHVVQDIELIAGVPVFYSLGNYIFDQYDSQNTQEGLLLQLELVGVQPQISLLPVTSEGTLSQPRFMKMDSHALFLENLAERSDPELRESIRSGQILLSTQVASSSKIAMISR